MDQIFKDAIDVPEYYSRIFRDMKGWDKLENLGNHVFFPDNHYIVMPGDTIDYFYLVLDGRVLSVEITEDGTEHIFNIFEPGSIFLESNVLADYPSEVSFRTAMPTECVRIDRQTCRDAMRQDEDITQLIFNSFASKFYSAMAQLRKHYDHDAQWQIYNMMVQLAESLGKPYFGNWIMIDMKMNQQFISNLLGLNRITVSRAIKELKKQGMIIQVNENYCINRN